MTTLQITGLVVFIVVIAGILGYLFQAGKNLQEPPTENFDQYTEQELENIKLAEELYNKDLRLETSQPVTQVEVEDINVVEPEFVSKETKKPKLESPIEKPKKKRKPRPNTKK